MFLEDIWWNRWGAIIGLYRSNDGTRATIVVLNKWAKTISTADWRIVPGSGNLSLRNRTISYPGQLFLAYGRPWMGDHWARGRELFTERQFNFYREAMQETMLVHALSSIFQPIN